jgi:hypothetical protein
MSRRVLEVQQGSVATLHHFKYKECLAPRWRPSETRCDVKLHELTVKGRIRLKTEAKSGRASQTFVSVILVGTPEEDESTDHGGFSPERA